MLTEYAWGIADYIQKQSADGIDPADAYRIYEEQVRSGLLEWAITEQEAQRLGAVFDEFFPYFRRGLAAEGVPNE